MSGHKIWRELRDARLAKMTPGARAEYEHRYAGEAMKARIAAIDVVGLRNQHMPWAHSITPSFNGWCQVCDENYPCWTITLLDAIAVAEDRADAYETALRYYADPATWQENPPMSDEYGANPPDVWDDKGATAREALAASGPSDLETALRLIKLREGRVCSGFELCHHDACRSSCNAWFIANAALTGRLDEILTDTDREALAAGAGGV